ncbi:MAG: exosortase C-terminal domain/associated protein EpsI [Myxococcota bacterium]
MLKFIAAFLVLGLNTYVYFYLGSSEVIPPRTEFLHFPDEIGAWECSNREVLDDEVINNLQVTDYLSCAYMNEEDNSGLHLYIGYHERQTRDRGTGKASAIHPPEHCLPGSGWDVIDSTIIPVTAGPGGEAKRFVIAKGNQRALVYFWYHSRGRVLARSHEKISYMFLDRATRGRTDGSLVRFTVPIEFGDEEAAEARFKAFADQVTPLLSAYVPD